MSSPITSDTPLAETNEGLQTDATQLKVNNFRMAAKA